VLRLLTVAFANSLLKAGFSESLFIQPSTYTAGCVGSQETLKYQWYRLPTSNGRALDGREYGTTPGIRVSFTVPS